MENKKLKKILLICGTVIGVLVGIFVIFLTIQIIKAPNLSEVDAAPEGYLSTILDKNEEVINTLYVTESNRIHVELENIPKDLQEAFIAIEDSRFYKHNGIDLKGIIRAFGKGVANGKFSQGASTITQQLLKNNVFTDWMSESSFYDKFCRKIQEQYLAIKLENRYSKEWILENYLNTINLGGGTRGVQVAAQYYFGKDVSQLSLAECALIAGITKNPASYNPLNHPRESIERQELVLDAMLEQKYITNMEYREALAEDVLGALNKDFENRGMRIFSWFEDALLLQIVEDLMEEYGYDEEKAWDMIYNDGLIIHSTLDMELQKICEETAVDRSWYTDNQEISIVVMDTSSGAVRAIVGSSHEKENSLAYNRATDAIRQPGSVIKVIGEYAAALDSGEFALGTVIDDAPYTYSDGTKIGNADGTYKGMTTIRQAITDSSNIVALKTFQMVGVEKVYNYLQKFGISTLTTADMYESLSIGGTYNGVTNLEMTGAYNAIANDGQYNKPYFYTKVVDHDGRTILSNYGDYKQIINSETAELLTSAMEDVMTEGTGTSAAVSGLTLAGKSGTTNDKKDLWFIGFSSYYTCGVWGGYDDNSPQTNSSYVKKIWRKIMKEAHTDKTNFPITNTSDLTEVTICTKCGNLAVEGLCDNTIAGNMAEREYYGVGTAPVDYCDCHVNVAICTASEAVAGDYCPDSTIENRVYLKQASEGTVDSQYVLPMGLEETCSQHQHFWDSWFDNWWSNEQETPNDKPIENGNLTDRPSENESLENDIPTDRPSDNGTMENGNPNNRPSENESLDNGMPTDRPENNGHQNHWEEDTWNENPSQDNSNHNNSHGENEGRFVTFHTHANHLLIDVGRM